MKVKKTMTNTNYKFTFIPITKSEDAKLPLQEEGNVGFDVSSVDTGTIVPGGVGKFQTGLRLADDIYSDNLTTVAFMKIEGRSGLAARGVFPVGGIIDPSYRGDITVMLHNSTKEPFVVNEGDRIAQLICYTTIANNNFHKVRFVVAEQATTTNRGEQGFGSTGMK